MEKFEQENDRFVVSEDYTYLEAQIREFISKKYEFERLIISKKDMLEMFKVIIYINDLRIININSGLLMRLFRMGKPGLFTVVGL